MTKLILIAGLVALTLSPAPEAGAGDGRPPEPWPGPKGDYVFLEAEDFSAADGWSVENSPIHLRTPTHSNLKFLAGQGRGRGTPSRTVAVPSDGTYRFWVHHSRHAAKDDAHRGAFRMTVVQNGKEVFSHDYSNTARPDDSTKAGFPPFRWEDATATLAQGEATVMVQKLGVDATSAQQRMVDCLLFTKDLAYEPDYRDFAPQTYVRIRLVAVDPGPVYFYGFLDHMRSPWYASMTLSAKGLRIGAAGPAKEQLVAAGSSTPWSNLSRLLYTGSDTNIAFEARLGARDREVQTSHYAVDFATAPEEAAVVATVERKGAGLGLMLRMPPDLTDGRRPKSDQEYATENLALATRAAAEVRFGKLPEKFPILADIRAGDTRSTPGVRKMELEAFRALGLSGLSRPLTEADVAGGLRFGRIGVGTRHLGEGGFCDPQVDRIKASIARAASDLSRDPHRNRYVAATLMDEDSPLSLEEMGKKPFVQKAFGEWLRSRGREPQEFGASAWEEVRLTADRNSRSPALYLASQQFRAWSIVQFYRQASQMTAAALPASVPSTQNFSDGAVYCANFYAQGNDYFEWFRNQALDLAWSEDWTNGGSTPQLCGWNVALLRAATREHGQPIGMYVIAGHGKKVMDVKLKAYSDLAQGAKILELFPYSAPYGSHETSWYLREPIYSAVAQLTREIGAAEHVLVDARPPVADTVILYSRASDIWNADYDSIDGHERMHTYLALRHAQIAVDVMDEVDVSGGALAGRRVAYLFGEQLDRRCVAPLARWVRDGGTLVLSPGAGGRNELNAEDGALDKELDLSRGPVARDRVHWGRSRDLRLPKSSGSVVLPDPATRFEFTAVRQALTARDGDTIAAAFDSGGPAHVTRRVGKGRVVAVGFLPALSYIRAALGLETKGPKEGVAAIDGVDRDAVGTKSSAPPGSAFPARLRDLICGPVRAASTRQPVEADLPLVEATLLEGGAGWVVPLANYTLTPAAKVTVTIRPGNRAFGEVRSSRQGVLSVERIGDNAVRVTLPLDSTDLVFAEWAPNK